MPYQLHPQLAADCAVLGQTQLCDLLLFNDQRIPWFILVPRREGVREIYKLTHDDQAVLWQESSVLSATIMDYFDGEKLNVAALGNQVPQLHLHHVVRHQGDPAWPNPVWGNFEVRPWAEDSLQQRCAELRDELKHILVDS